MTTKKDPAAPTPSQALVTVQSTSLAAPMHAVPHGGEEIRPEDMRLPVWRFLQPTSDEVQSGAEKQGLLKNSSTGETKESLEFIPVYLRKTRVHFDKETPKGAPLCSSTDLLHGTSCGCGCENDCTKCAFASWQLDPKTNQRKPPACSITDNFICISLEDLARDEVSPTVIRFAKSSAPAGQKISSVTMMTRKRDAQKQIVPVDLWDYVWLLKLTSKKFTQGTVFVAEVQRMRRTTEDEAAWAASLYTELRRARKVEIDAPEEAGV